MEDIKTWLIPLATAVFSLGGAWVMLKNTSKKTEKIDEHEKRLTIVETRASEISTHENRLTVVETKVASQQKSHDELKSDMRQGFAEMKETIVAASESVKSEVDKVREETRQDHQQTRRDLHDLRNSLTPRGLKG